MSAKSGEKEFVFDAVFLFETYIMAPKHAIYKNKILWKFNMKISCIIYENLYNNRCMYHFRYEINLEIETFLPE